MIQKNKTLVWVTCLTLALYFSRIFVFITPLPLIYFGLKHREKGSGTVVAWPALLVVMGIYMLGLEGFWQLIQSHPSVVWFFSIPNAELRLFFPLSTVQFMGISYFCVFAAMGYFIALALVSPKDKVFKILSASLLGLFVLGGLVAFFAISPQADVFLENYRQYVEAGLKDFIGAQEKAGLGLSQLVYLKSKISTLADYSFFMLPFVVLFSLAMVFVLNLVVAKRLFLPAFHHLTAVRLTSFKVPFYFVWTAVGLVVLLMVNEKFFEWDFLHFSALNVLLTLSLAYFFQGLAVAVFLLEKKKIYGLARLLIYLVMMMFAQAMLMLLALLGFADNWLDLRRLEKKPPAVKEAGGVSLS